MGSIGWLHHRLGQNVFALADYDRIGAYRQTAGIAGIGKVEGQTVNVIRQYFGLELCLCAVQTVDSVKLNWRFPIRTLCEPYFQVDGNDDTFPVDSNHRR